MERFNHVAISYTTLLEQKKVLNGKNVDLPREWFGTPKWLCFHCSGTERVRSIGNLDFKIVIEREIRKRI